MTKFNQPLVYVYVADDGTTYWSFTQHAATVSQPKRLVLQSRKGTVLGLFLAALRSQGMALLRMRRKNPDGENPSE